MTDERARTSEERIRRDFVRHTLATLAYRAEKVLRDVPDGFASFRAGPDTRTPLEILSHLGDLMAWAVTFTEEKPRWEALQSDDWDEAVARFFEELERVDRALSQDDKETNRPLEVVFQAPIADALTHVGQIALLRGMSGLRVRPENYSRAKVESGRVKRDQSAERTEFDEDASWPENTPKE
ncbi:MAG: hypothetical protein H6682_17150 [Candidatus Eisenbacteria bacterium]|nr:hypothetical protein [Candidatus Eisenbacteria bacterium]